MPVFTIKQNDTKPIYEGTIQIEGVDVDLTSATLLFKMIDDTGALLVNASATPDADQSNNRGEFTYEWLATDTAQAGRMKAEVEVTFVDATVQTFPTVGFETIIIRGDLDSQGRNP